ncbi:shikimate kinase [Segnochrobactraceae bacterium EtOH-i3]
MPFPSPTYSPALSPPSDAELPTGELERAVLAGLGNRALVLIGMMGAGKTSIGRRLAQRLRLPFLDADQEIEAAAAMTIPEIFATHGEPAFRDGERRVIQRILSAGVPQVLSTGGGAFLNAATRQSVGESGIAIWLNAEPEVLFSRVKRRSNRPLLNTPDPEGTLRRLLAEREPFYALADLTVRSRDVAHDVVVNEILAALVERFRAEAMAQTTEGGTPE